ncbi:MAG: NUDIX hydrolase [Deltaproteobacteria bacterium]|nr:NUDIX hydrolase [Deltaproteobacteria bacterium]
MPNLKNRKNPASGNHKTNENPESTLKAWRFVEDRERFKTPVFKVMDRRTVSPKDGREKDFSVLAAPDWVNVLALTPENEVVLVRQYRHGSKDFSLELPGGVSEEGDGPEKTALRELMEETGYGVLKLERLLTLNPNPALFSNNVITFLGTGAEKKGAVSFDENEETELVLVSVPRLRELYLEGRFTHALMSAPIGYFLLKRSIGMANPIAGVPSA